MTQLNVTDVPVQVNAKGSGTLVVQNLDPTNPVYLEYSSEVTSSGPTGGIRLSPGLSTEWKVRTDGNAVYPPATLVIGPWAVCEPGKTAVIGYVVFLD